MAARSGKDYLASIRAAQPTVYLEGQVVGDVTSHPAFTGALESVMEQYDLQLDPAYRDVCLYESPTTGDLVSTSFMQPRSQADVVRRRRHFKLRADQNFGTMGRSPDFMNAFVAGIGAAAPWFASRGPEFGERARRYSEEMRERDMFMTHVLVNPQTDRSKTSAEQEDPHIHLCRVGETDEGMIVRGAKMLATMAPLTEEVVVTPYGGVAPGDDAYALTFAVPSNTPGLKFVCREPFSVGRSAFDHPLSSRFEEMDCVAIFDDVVVPWDRVFVDGTAGSGAFLNALPPTGGTGVVHQTGARLLASMELLCGVACRVADAIGIDGFLHVQEKLGEMLILLDGSRAAFYGAEAMAVELPDGTWMPYLSGLMSMHFQAGKIHARFVEIVQILCAGGFFYAPTGADFANDELRPFLDKFVRGRPGVSAEERVRLFKLAWDLTGDAFGQRLQQYVRFYSGDPIRNAAGAYLRYDKQQLSDIVDRALDGVDHALIPLSPEDPRWPDRPPTRPVGLASTYPAASHPAPTASRQPR